MPKENRFAGLGEALGEGETPAESESEGDDDEATSERDGGETEAATESTVEDADEAAEGDGDEGSASADEGETNDDGSTGTDDDGTGADEGGPAFEFEATTAKSIYVRRETLDRMDDAEFEVESLLRRDHDVRDLTGREFHDALVRVAAEYPDEIVEAVLDAREE